MTLRSSSHSNRPVYETIQYVVWMDDNEILSLTTLPESGEMQKKMMMVPKREKTLLLHALMWHRWNADSTSTTTGEQQRVTEGDWMDLTREAFDERQQSTVIPSST